MEEEPNNNKAKGADGKDEAKAGDNPAKLPRSVRMKNSCAAFGKFMYNSETHEVMGRTGFSWRKSDNLSALELCNLTNKCLFLTHNLVRN